MRIAVAICLLLVADANARTHVDNASLRRAPWFSMFEQRRQAALQLHRLGDNSGVPVIIENMSALTNQTDRNSAG
jgi:hypothetical protein